MIAYPFDRRTGQDRRSGRDRRQMDNEMYVPSAREETKESFEAAQNEEEPRKELAEVWNRKGENHFTRREYERAKQAFAKAVEIKPEFALAWYNLAKVHSHEGEKEQAMTKLKRAIKLDPGCREKARTESFFKKFKGEKEFDKLIR
jgi:tetratricopeptide (TPR) repeat protein